MTTVTQIEESSTEVLTTVLETVDRPAYKLTVYWKVGVHPDGKKSTSWEPVKNAVVKDGVLMVDSGVGIPIANILYYVCAVQ